jgi:hypothetical protein
MSRIGLAARIKAAAAEEPDFSKRQSVPSGSPAGPHQRSPAAKERPAFAVLLSAHPVASAQHGKFSAGPAGPHAHVPMDMLLRLQSSIDAVAPARVVPPPQVQSPRAVRPAAEDLWRGTGGGHEEAGGGESAPLFALVSPPREQAARMIAGRDATRTSVGLVPLPRDTLSVRGAIANGNAGVLAQAFSALPRRSQVAARELALDIAALHAKLDVVRTRLGPDGGGRVPTVARELEDALASRLAQLMSVAGEGLGSALLDELGRSPEGVRDALGLPEPNEREEDVHGSRTGVGGDATGLWRRRMGMRNVATVRSASHPSALVFASLPADGICADGSRDLFKQKTNSNRGGGSYYEGQQARYGKGRRGSTSIAGGDVWAAVWGEQGEEEQEGAGGSVAHSGLESLQSSLAGRGQHGEQGGGGAGEVAYSVLLRASAPAPWGAAAAAVPQPALLAPPSARRAPTPSALTGDEFTRMLDSAEAMLRGLQRSSPERRT